MTPIRSIALCTALVISGLTALVTAAPAAATPTTIVVTEVASTDTVTDIGSPGDSVGDQLTFANQVYGAHARRVGSDSGYCVRVVAGHEWDCGWTLFLRDGQITVRGPFFDHADSLLAITGGTGRYIGARGEMTLAHIVPDDSRFRFTYRLV